MSSRLATVMVLGAPIAMIACSAVLGLDEPTHRTDGGTTSASGAGGAGSSGGAAGNDTGASGVNPGSGGASAGEGGASVAGAGGANAAGAGGGTGGTSLDAGVARDSGIDAGRVGCQGLPLCDDFEGPAVGALPDMSKWTIPPNAVPQLSIIIDGSVFSSGKKSVYVQGSVANGAGEAMMFSNKAPLNVGSVRYVRLHAFIKDATGSMGFMAIRDAKDPNRYLVLGTFVNALTYFLTQGPSFGQHVLPSDDAQLQTSFHPMNSKWFCVEMKLDSTVPSKPTIQTWVDGNAIAALAADGTPTPGIDDTWGLMNPFQPDAYVGFGAWPGQGTPTATLYLDDVAVAGTRIGCN